MRTVHAALLLFFFLMCLSISASAAMAHIPVAANKGVINNYQGFVRDRGGDPHAISDYSGPNAIRPSVSLVLMAQALKLGGLDCQFEFIASPNSGRSVSQVKAGHAVLYQADIWESIFDESVFKSDAMIESGKFQKGFFSRENSSFIQKAPRLDTLLSAPMLLEVTWQKDLSALKQLHFVDVETTPRYESLLSMVAAGRRELTLLEFPDNEEMVHYSKHGRLYPVPGIKVCFQESRHFMVSKVHPLGEQVFSALQDGLRILKKRGTVEKAYRESGVFNTRVEGWKTLTIEK